MSAYYNENDPKAAAWLRELIKVGAIAAGEVDERSIEDVTPNDLRDFTQHHFFAGIGGWSYALRLAGWSDDRPVWTGSCPCQPFSASGARRGFADERHLWPAWFHLIQQFQPASIFGEQVSAALEWIDVVSANLEAENYAVGTVIIGAHSVGAPHIRQRLYWVADRSGSRLHANKSKQQHEAVHHAGQEQSERCGTTGELGDADQERQQQHAQLDGEAVAGTIPPPCWADASGSSFVDCQDGKRRPVEPGTFPLADGVPGRVGLLRGYGNAIVPRAAAEFVSAYLAI